MFELVHAMGNSYYIQSPAKIGLVRLSESTACIIDSGSNKEAGRKVRQVLEQNGWQLTAIYNTHSNADHIGGNQYLQRQTGCRIFAPGVERCFTSHPILEPAFLYGGFPLQELRHKFLLAQGSQAEYVQPELLPKGFGLIPLPGHFFEMVGYLSPDGVAYIADCLVSAETLQKYRVSFVYDVEAYLATLKAVQGMSANLFIPSHADPAENIAPLAQLNIDGVMAVASLLLELCKEPVGFDMLLKGVFCRFGLEMNFEQYVLVGSTVRSYLAWLKGCGSLNAWFENNLLLWQRA